AVEGCAGNLSSPAFAGGNKYSGIADLPIVLCMSASSHLSWSYNPSLSSLAEASPLLMSVHASAAHAKVSSSLCPVLSFPAIPPAMFLLYVCASWRSMALIPSVSASNVRSPPHSSPE
ncbi:hypothetical protein DNTS_008793, partial [Danionella cerebrum]